MTPAEMETRLCQTYPNAQVAVIDLTGSENHYEVRISARELSSLSRIEQHQAVMSVFNEELKSGEVHALSIKILSLND